MILFVYIFQHIVFELLTVELLIDCDELNLFCFDLILEVLPLYSLWFLFFVLIVVSFVDIVAINKFWGASQ